MLVRALKDEVQKRTHLEQQLHVSRQQENFLFVYQKRLSISSVADATFSLGEAAVAARSAVCVFVSLALARAPSQSATCHGNNGGWCYQQGLLHPK
jgi:hypothetical protein